MFSFILSPFLYYPFNRSRHSLELVPILALNPTPIQGMQPPVQVPMTGNMAFRTDGSFTYTLDIGFNGTNFFTDEVCDTPGLCITAVVTLSVGLNTVITNRRITYRVNPI